MNRPITITIAAILVVVLLAFSAVWPLVGGNQLFGLNDNFPGGALPAQGGQAPQGVPPENGGMPQMGQNPQGTPSATTGTFQPGPQHGASTTPEAVDPPQGDQPGPQTPPEAGNTVPGQMQSGEQPNQFSAMRIVQYALYALVIIFGLIAFGGLWAWKRWGNIMAVITAVAAVITTFVDSFNFNTVSFNLSNNVVLIEAAISVLLVVVIIVLVTMRKSRPSQEVNS